MEDLLKNLKLEYIMLVLIIVPLVIGMLLGMLRGSRRAALRLVLVLLCVVAAFCLRGVVTNAVLSMPVDGQTLEQTIISQLPEDAAQLGDNLMPIVRLLVTVVLFLTLFFVIKFISWAIIYPLCKLLPLDDCCNASTDSIRLPTFTSNPLNTKHNTTATAAPCTKPITPPIKACFLPRVPSFLMRAFLTNSLQRG